MERKAADERDGAKRQLRRPCFARLKHPLKLKHHGSNVELEFLIVLLVKCVLSKHCIPFVPEYNLEAWQGGLLHSKGLQLWPTPSQPVTVWLWGIGWVR